jgi:hypothetical protein
VSVATGALNVTEHSNPELVDVQFGDPDVRFTTTGVPPLTAIVADFVADEI